MASNRSKTFCVISVAVAIIGLAGLPGNLRIWLEWSKVVNWEYWLNSGEWLPWGIRAFIVGVITYLAISPEFTIRVRDKIFPKWLDGTPMGFTFRFGGWRAGIEDWWEDRRAKKRKP